MFANPSRQWKQIHVQRKTVTDWTYKEDDSLLTVTESINEVNYKFAEVGLNSCYLQLCAKLNAQLNWIQDTQDYCTIIGF